MKDWSTFWLIVDSTQGWPPLPSDSVFEEISEDTADISGNTASTSLPIWSDQYSGTVVLFFTACHLVFDISESTCVHR
jgi:hypothetical protein